MSVEALVPSTTNEDRHELLARLRRDGALYFPSLLPDEPIAALRADLAQALSSHDWLAEHNSPYDLIPRTLARHGAPGWWRLYQAMQSVERFHALAHAHELLTVVTRLLGGRILNHPRRQVTMISPGFWIPPYQEHLYVQGTADVLTAWIPLDAGASPQILGEKAPRQLRAVNRDAHNGVGITLTSDEETWLAPDAEPRRGDVILTHAMAIRRTPRHTGPDLRLSVEFRYQPAFEPIARGSLMPHHYPRIAGWPELSRLWSSRRWIRTPLVKHVVEFVMPTEIEQWHLLVPQHRSALVDMSPAQLCEPW